MTGSASHPGPTPTAKTLRGRMTVLGLACLLLATAAGSSGDAWSQSPATQPDSLAAWEGIAAVLHHPRCLNCHQLDAPLQGDTRRAHIPPVVRGPDNLGTGTMRRRNCHNESGNNEMSGVPGASHWQLAPASMLWEGLSTAELCRVLKDPALNGNRTPDSLVKHMNTDKLVLWGWQPGAGREPVPISHQEFIGLLEIWVAGGAACPQ